MPRDLHMEEAWAGAIGDVYTARDLNTAHRRPFWRKLIKEHEIANALEVGCSYGANLKQLVKWIDVTGIDINQGALDRVPKKIPTHCCSATDLPFDDESFDLTFTTGVLVHVPTVELSKVMSEIVRTSRRYVLCGEYYAPEEESHSWGGLGDGLWRRDYGGIYERDFPLTLIDKGEMSDGTWEGVTWWLFEKGKK